MDVGEILLLIGAGLIAGGVNAIAGGGSLIVFPAMLAVGMPPLQANVTNSVAQWPGYVGGVIGFAPELRDQKARVRGLTLAAVAGAVVGCVLLLLLPGAVFDAVVPALVLLASALLAFQPRIGAAIARRKARNTDTEPEPESEAGPAASAARSGNSRAVIPAVFVASIYGGYFGGALGLILISVLSLTINDSLRRLNALKSAISLVVATATVVAFGIFGPVDWRAVAVVAPATLVGGVVGARIARRIPDRPLRWVVVALGVAVGCYLAVRAIRGD